MFLPEDWAADRDRCREAGIPDDVAYQPKWRIALDLYDRASQGGVGFDWLACDEGSGGKPDFLRELDARERVFVAEVPTTSTGWIDEPQVTERPFRRAKGRGRKTPRLVAGSRPAIAVGNMPRYSPALRDQAWVSYHVKDGRKGPIVWEAKQTQLTVKDENGLPGMRWHLVVARNVLDPAEIKFFVGNAPAETGVPTLLLVGFSRRRVERCVQDQKQKVGLDQWEGRRRLRLKRHLILTSVSDLFPAGVREQLGEKNPEITVCQVHAAVGSLVRSWWLSGRVSAALIEWTSPRIVGAQLRAYTAREEHEKWRSGNVVITRTSSRPRR